MTHLSDPPWDWLWPGGPPSGGRMILDRYRRLKDPEPDLSPVPETPPAALPVLCKLELFFMTYASAIAASYSSLLATSIV
jgi:hypothetical protein